MWRSHDWKLCDHHFSCKMATPLLLASSLCARERLKRDRNTSIGKRGTEEDDRKKCRSWRNNMPPLPTCCKYSRPTAAVIKVNVLKFYTLNFLTKWHMQTLQTQIRLLPQKQSDQGLHCLKFTYILTNSSCICFDLLLIWAFCCLSSTRL